MKTTKEMIEVMQAYDRGEQIQILDINGIWEDKEYPYWNWTQCDYRVKPKTKYVPFDTAEEFLAAQIDHGTSVYVINRGVYYAYINAQNEIILVNDNDEKIYHPTFHGLFRTCKFSDGTPCGKEVEVCQI